MPRLLPSPFKRGKTASYGRRSRRKPDEQAHERLPVSDGAGVKVAREGCSKFVRGDIIDNDMRWRLEEKLDPLAPEPADLHIELQGGLDTKQDVNRVEHLGHAVMCSMV